MMLFSIAHTTDDRVPPTFKAVCRSGTGEGRPKCKDSSHLSVSSDEIEEWVAGHYKETGHTGYTLVSGLSINISPHDAGLYPPREFRVIVRPIETGPADA